MSDSTQVTSVICNHCGATLEIPAAAHFLTCTYCGAKLEIHRSASAVYTQVLESIDQRAQQMASDMTAIRRQSDLETLDRQWMMCRERLMSHDRWGRPHVPNASGSIIGALLAAGFGVIWISVASTRGSPPWLPLLGVIFVIAALVRGVHGVMKASEYEAVEESYEQQRAQILRDQENPPEY